MIKAVIFDMDGVLLDSFEANLDFFQRLMKKAGYPAMTRKQYRALFHKNMADVIKSHVKDITDEEVEKVLDFRRRREVVHDVSMLDFPEDLSEVIDKLSKRYLLGIATSRVREGVYRSPEMVALKKYFKTAVAYEDTKNHKPHPEPLLLAAKNLKLRPGECVYIGDAKTDIEAAHAAGMKCVIYSKRKLKGADAWTADFKKIPEVVAQFRK